MNQKTWLNKQTTTFFGSSSGELVKTSAPKVAHSAQSTFENSNSVFVRGTVSKSNGGVSFKLDPLSVQRKLAVQALNEPTGAASTATNKVKR